MNSSVAERIDFPPSEIIGGKETTGSKISGSIPAFQGQDGWLFSERSVELLYRRSQMLPALIDEWKHELASREAYFSNTKIQYLHLCVPDKATVLDHYLADSESVAKNQFSPLAQLSAAMKSVGVSLVNPSQYIAQQKQDLLLYWKTDTRWTPNAAFMAYQMLCGRLNIPFNEQLLGYRSIESDLILNLTDGESIEDQERVQTYYFERHSKRRFANELVQLRESVFDAGHRLLSNSDIGLGSRVVYENKSDKASNRCLIIFGNEFSSERRDLLTGMFAETYSEVHFVWADGIDYDYVDLVQPDYVITQGSESQLFESPKTQVDSNALARESLQALNDFVDNNRLSIVSGNLPRQEDPSGSRGETLATSKVVLPAERYTLDAPILVQPYTERPNLPTTMSSNDVVLHDVPGGKLFFTGRAYWIHDGNGNEVLKHAIPAHRKRPCWWRRKRKLDGTAFFLANSEGAHCYYHWMLETLPKLGMLEREGIQLDSINYFIVRKITADWQLETLEAFGIDRSRIIETANHFHWRADRLLHIEMNIGINLKMSKFIPQWMKHVYPTPQSAEPRLKLYLTRPKGVRRRILNEDAIIPVVKEAGFTVMAMEGLSVAEQAALMARVDVIISPHGGGLTNMVFCRPGTSVVELFSRHVFPYYYGLAAICGHRYHAIMEDSQSDYPRLVDPKVAQSFADAQHTTVSSDFKVSRKALREMLEIL